MKISCDVIQDLLPLYVENLASEDSRKMVEEHIRECPKCKKQLEKMTSGINIAIDTDIGPLRKIEFALQRKKILTIIFAVLATFVILTVAFAYVLSPRYFNYEDDLVTVSENSIGQVTVTFREDVVGYNINGYYDEEYAGHVYHLTAWDTTWDQWFGENEQISRVLNMEGEKVVAVYYYGPNEFPDVHIYGTDLVPNGGVTTLPRFALNYYFWAAVVMVLMIGGALVAVRKKEQIRTMMEKIFYFPLSYSVAHIIITGGKSTYSMERDLFFILLVAIALYGFILIAVSLTRAIKNKK